MPTRHQLTAEEEAAKSEEIASCFTSLTQLAHLRQLFLNHLESRFLEASSVEALCRSLSGTLEKFMVNFPGDPRTHFTAIAHVLDSARHLRALRSLSIYLFTLFSEIGLDVGATCLNEFQQLSFEVLPKLPDLREFLFEGPNVELVPTVTQARTLAQCVRLEHLSFGNSFGSEFDPRPYRQQILDTLVALAEGPAGRTLKVAPVCGSRSFLDDEIWSILQRMSNITEFSFWEWHIRGAAAWRQLGCFTHLREFTIHAQIDSLDAALNGLALCTALEWLNINGRDDVTDAQLRRLLRALSSLRVLFLSCLELESLAWLDAASSSLRTLNLSSCTRLLSARERIGRDNVDDDANDLRVLETLPAIPSLEELRIGVSAPHQRCDTSLTRDEQNATAIALLADRFPQFVGHPEAVFYHRQ